MRKRGERSLPKKKQTQSARCAERKKKTNIRQEKKNKDSYLTAEIRCRRGGNSYPPSKEGRESLSSLAGGVGKRK